MPRGRGRPKVVRREPLTAEERAELSELYWDDSNSVAELAVKFEVKPERLSTLVVPLPAGGLCRLCIGPTEYRSRTQRTKTTGVCAICNHREDPASCPCARCKADREELRQRDEAERWAQLAARRREYWADHTDEAYLKWALAQLTPAQRRYLDGVKQVILGPGRTVNWQWIAADLGLEPRHVARWIRVLEHYRVIGFFDNVVSLNPGLQQMRILGPGQKRPG